MEDLDYKVLRMLYKHGALKVGAISKKIEMPHSTIGSCIKRLENKGYVSYERYKPVVSTEKGKDVAMELIRHARLLEMLLINEFKIKAEDAHAECEKFNLLFSCDVINKICERYGHPTKCPCGEEILSPSCCICDKKI